jgi:hypothetical protein
MRKQDFIDGLIKASWGGINDMDEKTRVVYVARRMLVYKKAYEAMSKVVDEWEGGGISDTELLIAYNKFKHDISEKEEM